MIPKISVIIPVGPNRKMEATHSLKCQTIPVEIIVEVGKNPSENRNNGIKKAKAEIIAFVDAHSIMPSNWAEKIINFFNKYESIDIVGGPQITPKDESYFGKISGYALSSIFGAAGSSSRYAQKENIFNADERHLTSANLACRKKVIEIVKFDERLWPGEDPKFIQDAKKAGFRIAFNRDIVVSHRRRPTMKNLSEQIFRYGVARAKKEKIIETLMNNPSFLIPSLFVIYLIALPVLSLLSWIFAVPGAVYLILLLSFSLYHSFKNKQGSAIFLLSFIFFAIHILYGLGFITSIVTKVFKK